MTYIKLSLKRYDDLVYTQYLSHTEQNKLIGVVLPIPFEITHLELEFWNLEEKDDPSPNPG